MKQIKKIFGGNVKEIDTVKRTLTAVVSTKAVDRMGDIVVPEGVDLRKYRKNPVVLWAHDYSTPPVAKALWIKKKDGGIVSKMEFANTEFGNEIFELYKGGFLSAFSIGFSSVEREPVDQKKPYGGQKFMKSELLEFSAVPVPANPEALTMAVSKGILKDHSIIDQIEKGYEEEQIEKDHDYIEENDEDTIEEKDIQEETKDNVQDFDELIAENEILTKENEELKKQLTDLRYEKYLLLQKLNKSLSEIAVSNFGDKISGLVDGAIRKRQGKVD